MACLRQGPERRLILVRDRIGHRSLYYRHDDRGLAFATDLAALVSASGAAPPLDRRTLVERMVAECSGHEATLWSGILRLPPAHILVLDTGRCGHWRYWCPDYTAELRYARDEDYVAHYRELVFDTVRRQSRTQAPLAIEVSGGLDSSAVFAVAVQLQREGRLQAPGLVGLTIDCSEDPAANEIGHVRELARHLGQPIEEILPALSSTALAGMSGCGASGVTTTRNLQPAVGVTCLAVSGRTCASVARRHCGGCSVMALYTACRQACWAGCAACAIVFASACGAVITGLARTPWPMNCLASQHSDLPESLRRRRDKGEFSFAFRPLLTGLADFFRGQGSVPLPRAWVDDAGLEQLYEACAADPRPRVEGLMALVCVDGSGIAGQSEYG